MLSISFAADISSIESEMPKWALDRIPSITRNALNDTADDARYAEVLKIMGIFDRPTSYIARSPRYTKATKDNLTAEVYILTDGRIAPTKILLAEVQGGARQPKAFELALRRIGVMRPDEYAIPAIGQPRDAYGNLPGSLIVRIMSQLQAFTWSGYRANESERTRKRALKRGSARYFVPTGARQERGIGRLPRGVYERVGNKIRAVMIFVSVRPRYSRRYDFGQAAISKAERVFPDYWARYFYAELAKQTQ